MATTSSQRKAKTISKSSKPENLWETGLKYIQTHRNNTEALDTFSRQMGKLSDLARTVKDVTEEDSSSTNSMGFNTEK